MDPTSDPNFTPPLQGPPVPRAALPLLIPKSQPIQPFVLADHRAPIDAPVLHPLLSLRRNSHHGQKIPLASTDLQSDDSEESYGNDDYAAGTPDNAYAVLLAEHSHLADLPKHLAKLHDPSLEKHRSEKHGAGFNMPTLPRVQSYQIADLEEVPHGVRRQARTLDEYEFPAHRLATRMLDPSKHPLVIVACGLFLPITYLHLRMFEMAIDAIHESTKFEVIGGYYSPVSDNYRKPGLAPLHHRVRMCELACERTSSWLMVDAWESLQDQYTRTALVLDHFNTEVNVKRGGVLGADGVHKKVKVMLLAGGDLIESMGEPDVWADDDLHHILGRYGCLIVERTGLDVRSFLLSHDIMYEHRRNVLVIKQLIYNDISSTKVRLFLRRGMSVQYLLPNSVIRYIQEHRLYVNESEPVKQVLGKSAD